MKTFKEVIKEKEIIDNFVHYTARELGIKTLPRIELESSEDVAKINRSFGSYSPGASTIKVSTGGRHIADVLRTLGHE